MPVCRPGELRALWTDRHLLNVEEVPLTIDTRFSSFEDYWSPFLERQGPAGHYVASLAAAERGQLKRRLRTRLLGNGPDRPIVLRARAWTVRGTIP